MAKQLKFDTAIKRLDKLMHDMADDLTYNEYLNVRDMLISEVDNGND